jgi:hypothetical protein
LTDLVLALAGNLSALSERFGVLGNLLERGLAKICIERCLQACIASK